MAVPEPPRRLTVEEMYADDPYGEALEELLETSLDPRGPDLLFEMAGRLGAEAGAVVLDVGCRDGRQLLELHQRYGCRGVGIEPVQANLDRRSDVVDAAGLDVVRGIAEALPFSDDSFDLVWVRDVLIHVEALRDALAECRRVARPGAAVLVYQMFATPLLEPAESTRLWPSLAAIEANTDRAHFEAAVRDAGLTVEDCDELHGEWREHLEEHDRGRTSRQLLRVSRLLRDPERFRAALGDDSYEVEVADCLWGVYQMIGKLSPAIYVLRA
jgi:ubiquinone/menaquinone biosynthesis C-methylase UbiE